ncbi:hypothetical protein [Streptomyces adonidis]|uniref:hypothetical protein n=1 Tax=Streptomyces adonidis TaxID=3231367 RepID=UPI0034DB20B5
MDDKHQKQLLEEIDKRFGEQFTKLFKYFDDKIGALDAKIDTTADGERTYKSLDAIMDKLGDDETERAALTAQVDRHEDFVREAAPKLRISYGD